MQEWEQIERFDDDYSEFIKTLAELPTKPRIVLCTPTAMVLKTPELSESACRTCQNENLACKNYASGFASWPRNTQITRSPCWNSTPSFRIAPSCSVMATVCIPTPKVT